MFDQLQQALDKYQEREEIIAQLQTKNLELVEERDGLKEAAVRNEKFERMASLAVGYENKITRLMYELEKANVTILKQAQELNQLKGGESPKRLKDANKRLKEKNKELTEGLALIKKENSAYSREKLALEKTIEKQTVQLVASSGTFREIDDYQVMLWPAVMGVERGRSGKVEKLLSLLVMNPTGTGTLVTVKNGKARIPEEYGLIEEAYEKMPQAVTDFAEDWLGKVEMQGYNYTDADLLAFKDI